MTKSELDERINQKLYTSKDVSIEGVSSVILEQISDNLAIGRKVQIRSFGTWFLKKLRAGIRINPRTGENIKKEETFRARFRPSKSLLYNLNKFGGEEGLGSLPTEPEPLVDSEEAIAEMLKKQKENQENRK